MSRVKLLACGALCAFAFVVACGKNDSNSPVSPSTSTPAGIDAAADGSTLKVSAPAPASPDDGQVIETTPVVLTVSTSAPTHATGAQASFTYRFRVLNAAGAQVDQGVQTGGDGSTSFTITEELEANQTFTWQARAEYLGAAGPWSAVRRFVMPEQSKGFLRGDEVFDPLTKGTTVGKVVGPVTFLPGVGVKLEDFNSHIRYELPQTLTGGQFSLLVTNVATNTEGDKTKLFAMSEGFADIITNDRRFTVEKRGNPPGIVAWRMITRDDQIDTEGAAQRLFVNFDPNQVYLWTATWGGGQFNLRVREGGADGKIIYDRGKPYNGEYDPNPHFAYIGAPIGRSGAVSATVPGMVVRNVWISSKPRPAAIGH